MGVQQWWNSGGTVVEQTWKGQTEGSGGSLSQYDCSITYSKSTPLLLSWATAGRDIRLSCGVAMKNRFIFSHLLAT
jgi:hypothetical protein